MTTNPMHLPALTTARSPPTVPTTSRARAPHPANPFGNSPALKWRSCSSVCCSGAGTAAPAGRESGAHLRSAAQGRTILVGDRIKRPIARLGPINPTEDDLRIEQLDRDGLVRRGQGKLGHRPPAKKRTQRSVAAMVIEDRR
jgi:hypothetical protein